MRSTLTSRLAIAAFVLAGLIGATAHAEDPISARAFEVEFKPLADAAELVSTLLSDDGAVTMRPRLSTLVVEDRVSVLERVADLLEGYDLPPRNAEVTLTLFLGYRETRDGAEENGAEFSQEVRGTLERIREATQWTSYEPLGSRSITGAEGAEVTAQLSDEFRVVFILESVQETKGSIKFRSLALQRVTYDEDGAESVQDLYRTGMVLTAGKLRVVGAAADPNSERALFLMLQARAR